MHAQCTAGKDKAVFVTKEDYENEEALSVVVNDEEYGIILPNGDINWDCPCLGGMTHGPCGEEFKSSFSCFHYSEEDPKGADCIPQFKAMQECFQKYPELYPQDDDDDDETVDKVVTSEEETKHDPSATSSDVVPSSSEVGAHLDQSPSSHTVSSQPSNSTSQS